jgi:hypothetical protein
MHAFNLVITWGSRRHVMPLYSRLQAPPIALAVALIKSFAARVGISPLAVTYDIQAV